MNHQPINFAEKFGLFADYWSPRVVAELNDYQIKLVKIQGDFVWHRHENTDEVFVVLKGKMQIEFRDGIVALKEGEMFVVSKGVEHKPMARDECHIMLIEPQGVINTGDGDETLTAENDVWI